jgi:hypothetical protein
MKLLKFQKLNLQNEEILSRETMKQLMAGDDPYDGGAVRCSSSSCSNLISIYYPSFESGSCGVIKGSGIQNDACGCVSASKSVVDSTCNA